MHAQRYPGGPITEEERSLLLCIVEVARCSISGCRYAKGCRFEPEGPDLLRDSPICDDESAEVASRIALQVCKASLDLTGEPKLDVFR